MRTFTWFYPLKQKSDFTQCFINFHNYVNTQFEKNIRVFQSDGGGEFIGHQFQNYLLDNGIVHQMSCPYTPEQNGIAERNHRNVFLIRNIHMNNCLEQSLIMDLFVCLEHVAILACVIMLKISSMHALYRVSSWATVVSSRDIIVSIHPQIEFISPAMWFSKRSPILSATRALCILLLRLLLT